MTDAHNSLIHSILPIVQQVIASAMKVGGSGFFGKVREARAVGDFLAHARERFAGNPLIEGILHDLASEDGMDIDFQHFNLESALAQVSSLNTLLVSEGEQGNQVKEFLFELASKVVSAAGTGIFGSGEKVSVSEAEFLNRLKGGLGI